VSTPELDKVRLTRAQVLRLTADMRKPVTRLRAEDDDVQGFVWALVKRWRSFRMIDMASMARVTPKTLAMVVDSMEAQGFNITTEQVKDGAGRVMFICTKDMTDEQPNEG